VTPAELKVATDTGWTLLTGFLVFFMNAGFGLVEADRDNHAGQHDRVGQWQDRELQRVCHARCNTYTVACIPGRAEKLSRVRSGRNRRRIGPI